MICKQSIVYLFIIRFDPLLKKVCIVGASGLLGNKLIEKINDLEILGTYHQTPVNFKNSELIQLDITKPENCEKILKLNPDFIINAAAITDVDYCEKHPKKAYEVNVLGTKNLVEIAKKLDCKFIHISTDGIFSGKDNSYGENDLPDPQNYYGKTKLESENEVKTLNNFLICRTNLLYGYVPTIQLNKRSNYLKPTNFVLWILSQLSKNKSLQIVNDQFSNPTLVDNLTEIIEFALKKNLVGVFHTTDISCVSRFEFAQKIAKIFGFSQSLISPISSEQLNQFAKRPSHTCLDCSKIQNEDIALHTVDESLEILFSIISNEEPNLISKNKI